MIRQTASLFYSYCIEVYRLAAINFEHSLKSEYIFPLLF